MVGGVLEVTREISYCQCAGIRLVVVLLDIYYRAGPARENSGNVAACTLPSDPLLLVWVTILMHSRVTAVNAVRNQFTFHFSLISPLSNYYVSAIERLAGRHC